MKERRTVQKDMIYAALKDLHNHPTAEQVCVRVRQSCPSVSRATVYRVLGAMAEKGTVLRIPTADGADHFDDSTHLHFHVMCDNCGKMEDLLSPELQRALDAVQSPCGYELTGYTLLLHGLCQDCQKTMQAKTASVL